MTSATNDAGTVSFAYDELYRTVKVTNEDGTETSYTYDANGNRLSVTYPDGKAVTTAYDELGRVLSLTDHDGTDILYTRDAEGRVTKESYTDGSTTEYTYNAAGLLTLQKEVTKDNETLRQIVYAYDDAGNLTSENRSGVGIERKDELVRYYYDKADQLVKTNIEGEVKTYAYDKAGNLLSDGESTYTYDIQNRLLTKTNADGTTTYTYDKAGNLTREIAPDGITNYTYSAQNKLMKGEKTNGESSEYIYNALGVRIENVQVRTNRNAGNQNADLKDGSHGTDYLRFLKDGCASWQRVWETEIGTTVQNDKETVTRHYTVDYLSIANRDIYVTEDGSYTSRYVYDASGRRLSAEFDYAPGTKRGEAGENLQSDIAVSIGKVFYRTSILGSTLFAVDKNGKLIAHAIYDPWGKPLTETYADSNYSGLENLNNYTGYTWDITLKLYFAQNRFYDATTHRFTQEDAAKDGANWYVYCGNGPVLRVDVWGSRYSLAEGTVAHLTIQAYIEREHQGSLLDTVLYGLKRTKSGRGRPDVVIESNGNYHVYEIKSEFYSPSLELYSLGYKQLESYIDAINSNNPRNAKKYKDNITAIPGTCLDWDTHKIFPYLLDESKVIDAWTDRSTPGMIYYSIRGKKSNEFVIAPDFISEEYEQKIRRYEDLLVCGKPPREEYVFVDTFDDLALNNDIIAWLDSIRQDVINDGIFVYTRLRVPGEGPLYNFRGVGPKELYINFEMSRREKMNALSGKSFYGSWQSQPTVDLLKIFSMLGALGGLSFGGTPVPA